MQAAPEALIRPLVRDLHPYVPGEQPKIKGLIKLNTNENPYPPSPKVLAATRAAVDGRLRLYPNPTAQPLREKLARLHRCRPENIIVGNGSDELLAMAVRAFVEPSGQASAVQAGETPALRSSKSLVQFFTPSYSLYPVLADIHGAAAQRRAAERRLRPALRSPDLKTRPAMGLPRRPDLRHHAQRPQRPRLQHRTVGGALPRSEGRGGAGRGLRGFRPRKRPGAGAEVPARAGRPHLLEGLLALLPARRLFRRPPGPDRRAAQDPRQLQRQRPGPDRRAGDAGRPAPLPGQLPQDHCHARAPEPRA